MTLGITVDTHTRKMAPLMDFTDIQQIPSAFLCFYNGHTDYNLDSEAFEIELISGDMTTAKMVERIAVTDYLGPEMKANNDLNWSSDVREYPLAADYSILDSKIQRKRIPGEPSVDGWSTNERLQYWAAKMHRKHIQRHIMLFNRLGAQSILEGKQDTILDTTDTDKQYDFKRNSDHFMNVGTAWTDHTNATPINDLDDAALLMEQNGNRTPEFTLYGSTVMNNFVACDQVTNTANNRGYSVVRVGDGIQVPAKFSKMQASGWVCYAKVVTFQGREIWIFTNSQGYQKDDLTWVKLMPADKVVLGNTATRSDRYFGPGSNFDPKVLEERNLNLWGVDVESVSEPTNMTGPSGIIDPRMFNFEAYPASLRKNSIVLLTETAPIYAPVETNAWVTLENTV